jgi:serine/threonine-protein kinase
VSPSSTPAPQTGQAGGAVQAQPGKPARTPTRTTSGIKPPGEPSRAQPIPGRRSPTRLDAAAVPEAPPATEPAVQAQPGKPSARMQTRSSIQRAPTKPPPTPIGPGSIIEGRYRLEQALGSGGMSTVYRGTHVRTGGKLAIKLLDPRLSGKTDMQERTLQEARAMMDISSNHVVRAYDVGSTPTGQIYVVMEYLEGEDLDRLLQREGPLPWSRVAAMGMQICSGLGSAHAKGTYHRDIKPQNCFRVTVDRNPDHIKLIDFGIAKDTTNQKELTQDGMLLGTPEYMAPELISANAVPDARSDVYAVGATLYKLLTGSTPFFSKNILDLLYHQKHTEPEPPSKRAPDRQIPPIADRIVLRSLEKDPAKRFQSAEEMAQALLAGLDVSSVSGRMMSQPMIPIMAERSRPGTTPIGTPMPDEADASTLLNQPAAGDQTQHSQEYRPEEFRGASLRDVAMRGFTLLSIAALFGLASYVAAPPHSDRTTPETVVAADPEPVPEDSKAAPEPPPVPADTKVEAPPPEPPPPVDVKTTDAPTEPPPADVKATDAPTEPPPVPADTKVEAPPPETPPVPADTKVEAPPPEPTPVPTDSPPATPTEPPPADAAAAGVPDPDFNYKSAEKELRDQHKFFQNCLDDADQSGGKLKFSIEVRKSGMPPHKIKVFSSSSVIRACIRGLFEQFPFDSSPRGGAFAYTYNGGRGTFEKLPLSPTPTK